MYTEIEAKLKVDSLQQVEDKLAELGAEFVEEQLQKDCYFDDAQRSMTKSGKCLRLRRQATAEGEKIFLAYKGAREKDQFKKRQEIETEIADTDAAEKLLSVLGYKKVLSFEKKRRVWQFGGCSVALDELPLLGNFIEIEGPDDTKIYNVQENLDLADLPHIPESYAALVAEKLGQ